jgi:hypothetical protein
MKLQMRTLAMVALACGALACLGLLSPMAERRGCGLGATGACNHGASAAMTADDDPMITVQSPLVAALKALDKVQDAVEKGDRHTALSALGEARTLIELQINSPSSPGPTEDTSPAPTPPADARFMVITLPDPAAERGRN